MFANLVSKDARYFKTKLHETTPRDLCTLIIIIVPDFLVLYKNKNTSFRQFIFFVFFCFFKEDYYVNLVPVLWCHINMYRLFILFLIMFIITRTFLKYCSVWTPREVSLRLIIRYNECLAHCTKVHRNGSENNLPNNS